MAKKVEAYIKLQVAAGQANPSPPVGPALGQHGVNIMDFCKAFNAQTQSVEQGLPIPGRYYGLCGPLLYVRNENPACGCVASKSSRHREGLLDPQYGESCKGESRAVGRNRQDENARFNGSRHGCRCADYCGYRPGLWY